MGLGELFRRGVWCDHERGVVAASFLVLAEILFYWVYRSAVVTGFPRGSRRVIFDRPHHLDVDVHVLDGGLVDVLVRRVRLGRLSHNKIRVVYFLA